MIMAYYSDMDSTFFLLYLSKQALSPVIVISFLALAAMFVIPGGVAWLLSSCRRSIPGPTGLVMAFSGTAAHRTLANLANSLKATHLMAFSVGITRFIISSHPDTAKEILNSSAFVDRPIKESAYELLFHRAMGFAPFGQYWRNLRRISSTYLFSPKRISSFGKQRMDIGESMVGEIRELMKRDGMVEVKRVLHFGSLNNVMMSVFGKRYNFGEGDGVELESLVKEGYELLGMFNWSDHLPLFFACFDFQGVRKRCRNLVVRVTAFVGQIIDEHRKRRELDSGGVGDVDQAGDFVDVLLNLEEEKLSDSDMVAVLWVILHLHLLS